MITEKELLSNGFQKDKEWNNRIYYDKEGFRIVDHCGLYKTNNNHWSGYGKPIETIETLNEEFTKYVHKKIESLEKLIKTSSNELAKLKSLINLQR